MMLCGGIECHPISNQRQLKTQNYSTGNQGRRCVGQRQLQPVISRVTRQELVRKLDSTCLLSMYGMGCGPIRRIGN